MNLFQLSEATAARRKLPIDMRDSSNALQTGKTLTVTISKAGGAFGAIAGSVAEIGASGVYAVSLAAGDLDTLGQAVVMASATGCVTRTVFIQVVRFLDELHALYQDVFGPKDHAVTGADAGEDRVFESDGSTLVVKTRPVETISFTGANWTNATKRITKASAFTRYIWKTGDLVTLTAGTGVTLGQYTIASKVDDSTIELAADCNGAGGDIGGNTIAGEISNGRIMRTAG